MYKLLQNYTFEICTLSNIMNICCKYNIFLLVVPYLQALETKTRDFVPTYSTLVCYCRFDTVIIFFVNLHKNKMFLKAYQ